MVDVLEDSDTIKPADDSLLGRVLDGLDDKARAEVLRLCTRYSVGEDDPALMPIAIAGQVLTMTREVPAEIDKAIRGARDEAYKEAKLHLAQSLAKAHAEMTHQLGEAATKMAAKMAEAERKKAMVRAWLAGGAAALVIAVAAGLGGWAYGAHGLIGGVGAADGAAGESLARWNDGLANMVEQCQAQGGTINGRPACEMTLWVGGSAAPQN